MFFPDIVRKLKMKWMTANHFTSQFLTGHGGFKWKSTQFQVSTSKRSDPHEDESHRLVNPSMAEL